MTLLNLHHQGNQAQDTFVPTVPLDASTMRLYKLPGQQPQRQGRTTSRRPSQTWLRHLLCGLI